MYILIIIGTVLITHGGLDIMDTVGAGTMVGVIPITGGIILIMEEVIMLVGGAILLITVHLTMEVAITTPIIEVDITVITPMEEEVVTTIMDVVLPSHIMIMGEEVVFQEQIRDLIFQEQVQPDPVFQEQIQPDLMLPDLMSQDQVLTIM